MKIRTKVLAGAGALAVIGGMAAGPIAAGASGPATTAAPIEVVKCNVASGTATVNKPLGTTLQKTTILIAAGSTASGCTNTLGYTFTATSGLNITGKLSSTASACPAPIGPSTGAVPIMGTLTYHWNGVDAKLKALTSVIVTKGHTADDDGGLGLKQVLYGIVTKGVGVGGDASAEVIYGADPSPAGQDCITVPISHIDFYTDGADPYGGTANYKLSITY